MSVKYSELVKDSRLVCRRKESMVDERDDGCGKLFNTMNSDIVASILLMLSDWQVASLSRVDTNTYSAVSSVEKNNSYWRTRVCIALREEQLYTTTMWRDVYAFLATERYLDLLSYCKYDKEVSKIVYSMAASKGVCSFYSTVPHEIDLLANRVVRKRQLAFVLSLYLSGAIDEREYTIDAIFFAAAKVNNITVLRSLMYSNDVPPKVNIHSALHIAVMNNSLRAVKFLYESKDVHSKELSVSTMNVMSAITKPMARLILKYHMAAEDIVIQLLIRYIEENDLEMTTYVLKVYPKSSSLLGHKHVVLTVVQCCSYSMVQLLFGYVRWNDRTIERYLLAGGKYCHDYERSIVPLIMNLPEFHGDIAANQHILNAVTRGHYDTAIYFINHPKTDVTRWRNILLREALKWGANRVVQAIVSDTRFLESLEQ